MASPHPQPSFTIPATMPAVEMRGRGFENLRVVERPVPRPGPGQVLCRVEAASVCSLDAKLVELGPDCKALFGWDLGESPIVPGHEASLVIVAVGVGIGHRFRIGQRVVVSPDLPGPPRLDLDRYGVPARAIPHVSVGFTVPGFLSRYVLLREDVLGSPGSVVEVSASPSSLPHFGAALAQPFSAILAAHAGMVHVARSPVDGEPIPRAGVLAGGLTVVMGAGAMGLFHASHALLRRPRRVIVSEPDPVRRAAASRLGSLAELEGAELEAVEPSDLEDRVLAASGGRGADDIIVATGSSAAQETSIVIAAPGACINLFASMPPEEPEATIQAGDIHAKVLSVSGPLRSTPHELRRAVDLQERGAVDLGPFVCVVGGIAAAPAAIRAVAERRCAGKIVIYPQAAAPELVTVGEWGAEAEARFLSEPP
jgi:L-iditol 2-dehydrogenase